MSTYPSAGVNLPIPHEQKPKPEITALNRDINFIKETEYMININ